MRNADNLELGEILRALEKLGWPYFETFFDPDVLGMEYVSDAVHMNEQLLMEALNYKQGSFIFPDNSIIGKPL